MALRESLRKEGKSNILDIRAHTKSGEIIIVEVQLNLKRGFRERIAFLNSKAFAGQMNIGEDYCMLKRTVTVVITEFIMIKENEDCHNRFKWYNIEDGTLLTPAQEINFLELPKLPQEDDGSKLWRWLRFFKSGREDEMEELAKDSEGMQRVMATLREMSADEYERRCAEQAMISEMDRRAELAYSRDEGRAEGHAEGHAEGLMEGQFEIARKMKEKNYSIDAISDITGLSEEEIDRV